MVEASPGGRPTRRCGTGAVWTGGASWCCTATTRRFAGGIRFSSAERVRFSILPHKLFLWYKIFPGRSLHLTLVQDFLHTPQILLFDLLIRHPGIALAGGNR